MFSQFFWKFNFILRIGYTNKKPCGFPKIFPFCQGITVHLTGTLWKFRSGDGGREGCGWLVKGLVWSVSSRAEGWSTLWKGAEQNQAESSVWRPRGHTSTLGGEGCVGRRIVAMVITVGSWPTETEKALWRTKWPKEQEVEKWGWQPVRCLTWYGINYKKFNR